MSEKKTFVFPSGNVSLEMLTRSHQLQRLADGAVEVTTTFQSFNPDLSDLKLQVFMEKKLGIFKTQVRLKTSLLGKLDIEELNQHIFRQFWWHRRLAWRRRRRDVRGCRELSRSIFSTSVRSRRWR